VKKEGEGVEFGVRSEKIKKLLTDPSHLLLRGPFVDQSLLPFISVVIAT
jgi:hypothetical protein